MTNIKKSILTWLILIPLTFASVFAGNIISHKGLFIAVVFTMVFLKGLQITENFMELNNAPIKWRLLLVSYVLLVPIIIAAIYTVSIN